jgi:hypothetical protein
LPEPETDETADSAISLLDDINQEQWNYWHNHPCSRLLRKYLRDYSEALEQTAMNRWRAREIDLSTENEIRGRLVQLSEIEILKFEDVREFYEVPSQEQKTSA